MTNYNRSEIMRKANALRRFYGMSKSESLTKAWAMAKLAALQSKKGMLDNIDRWNNNDRQNANALVREISALESRIYPTVTKIYTKWHGYSRQEDMEARLAKIAAEKGTDSVEYTQLAQRIADKLTTHNCTVLDRNAYVLAA